MSYVGEVVEDGELEHYTISKTYVETDTGRAFDSVVAATGLFTILREVSGEYKFPTHHLQDKPKRKLRIDRVLLATPKLKANGWLHGAVGIEMKTTGTSFGVTACQMNEYQRCLFRLPDGSETWLDYVFAFPFPKLANGWGSFAAQTRIGTAYCNGLGFHLRSGEVTILSCTLSGSTVRCNPDSVNIGKKVGSR